MVYQMNNLAINSKKWKVKTDHGFVDFQGVAAMGEKRLYRISFTDDTEVTATATHNFYTLDGREIAVGELLPGVQLLGTTDKTVKDVEYIGVEQTYDLFNTATHTFFVNDLLSHNCQFISDDPLLIDPLVLANLTLIVEQCSPVAKSGEVVYYNLPQKNSTYLVGMDPATGSGSDFTTIVVYSFPEMEQVAEFRSNTMSSVTCYSILKKILKTLVSTESTVYFTVEANGVGEAILALMETDEDPILEAEFISEEGQNRKGMTTTGKSKMKGCLSLKEMLERSTLHIRSNVLLRELKTFGRKAGSYAAASGSTDDLVMATVLVIRMLNEIASYDQEAYDRLYSFTYDIPDDNWDDSQFGIDFIV